MNKSIRTAIFLAIAALAAAEEPSPVVRLSPRSASELNPKAYPSIPLTDSQFKTAAAVRVFSKGSSDLDAQRKSSAVSAVYAGVSLKPFRPKPVPAISAEPPLAHQFNFKVTGDGAQGWATMTAAGMPFLHATALGEAWTESSASWTAFVTVPAENNYIFVKFTLPRTSIGGACEEQGPSAWRSRLLADLLLNGHPVWSTESIRFNQLKPDNQKCEGVNGVHYTNAFGQLANLSSNASEVILSLGKFNAGQTLEIALAYRLEARSSTACEFDNEFFCSHAAASTEFSTATTPVAFYAGPAVP